VAQYVLTQVIWHLTHMTPLAVELRQPPLSKGSFVSVLAP
jgi:hypothetical protein